MSVHVEIESEPVVGPGVVLQVIRLVPMLFMAGVLTVAATAVAVAIGVTVVATGRVPQRLAGFRIHCDTATNPHVFRVLPSASQHTPMASGS